MLTNDICSRETNIDQFRIWTTSLNSPRSQLQNGGKNGRIRSLIALCYWLPVTPFPGAARYADKHEPCPNFSLQVFRLPRVKSCLRITEVRGCSSRVLKTA